MHDPPAPDENAWRQHEPRTERDYPAGAVTWFGLAVLSLGTPFLLRSLFFRFCPESCLDESRQAMPRRLGEVHENNGMRSAMSTTFLNGSPVQMAAEPGLPLFEPVSPVMPSSVTNLGCASQAAEVRTLNSSRTSIRIRPSLFLPLPSPPSPQ